MSLMRRSSGASIRLRPLSGRWGGGGVDDHSRLAYSEILPDEQSTACAPFLARAVAHFAGHGIARIERLMTDNAWVYRYSLTEVCACQRHHRCFVTPKN